MKAIIEKKVVYSETNSLERGLFWISSEKVKVGSLVVFDNPNPAMTSTHSKKLLKKVERIEDGKAFVISKSKEQLKKEYGVDLVGFDSHIFGLIPVEELQVVRRFYLTNFLVKICDYLNRFFRRLKSE